MVRYSVVGTAFGGRLEMLTLGEVGDEETRR